MGETSTATRSARLSLSSFQPAYVCNIFLGLRQMNWYLSLLCSLGKESVHFKTITKSLCNYFCTVVMHQFECIPVMLFTSKALLIEEVAVAGNIMMQYLSIRRVSLL